MSSDINFGVLRDAARRELLDLLDSRRGKKALVLDPTLSGTLHLIVPPAVLREHGVEHIDVLTHGDAPAADCRVVVYLVRPRLELMPLLAAQVKAASHRTPPHDFVLLFAPRRTVVCEKLLEAGGVYGELSIAELSLDWVPLEPDLLSLELPASLRQVAVDGDPSALYYAARALHRLQVTVTGTAAHIKAVGPAAVAVADMMARLRREGGPSPSPSLSVSLGGIVLLDRLVDAVTPLATQLTYEGLLDELFGVAGGAVEMEEPAAAATATVTGAGGAPAPGPSASPPPDRRRIPLGDALHAELKGLNFGAAAGVLRAKATGMRSDYRGLTPEIRREQTVGELKGFVQRLSALPDLQRHAGLAERAAAAAKHPSFGDRLKTERELLEGVPGAVDRACVALEAACAAQRPAADVLRSACLASTAGGGLPRKTYDTLRREMLAAYGPGLLPALCDLSTSGLLRRGDAPHQVPGAAIPGSGFAAARIPLKLMVDAPAGDAAAAAEAASPTDIGYTYGGYAPLSIRCVQAAVRTGWRPILEVIHQLPGPHAERRQGWDAAGMATDGPETRGIAEAPPEPALGEQRGDGGGVGGARGKDRGNEVPPAVLVVFLGGVTYAEIAALRFLSSQPGAPCTYLVATTAVINGRTMIAALVGPLGEAAIQRGAASAIVGARAAIV